MNKNLKHFLFFLLVIVGFIGYKLVTTSGIEQISTEQLAEMMADEQNQDVFFVDVRETNEFTAGHIAGMTNVPLSTLEENAHLIPNDQKVVVFCRSGKRSLQASNTLKGLGYNNLINVKGGMLAWKGEVVK
ncbi:rhodanese-like domain-containing protein [Bacillus alkalicellulosilyticus]|uniref:rhodanese-like domain-containing protein n=1 Tax=Alkalihalobacterium alkalicellulosilyticum TaxID=1912214 RepID=UPI0009989BAD|nr:rhodanese-like domain-containing protein [Bacillus alkalicellulosilyticus]